MIPKTGWKVGAVFGRMAVRSVLLAMVSGMLWLSPAPAQEKTAPDEARLSDLTIWQGPTFGTGTADFGSGVGKGLESFGNALMKAVMPELGDRFALTPPFRADIGSYSVTIGYRMTAISVAAARRDPDAVITMAGRGPDGAPLKTGTRMEGINLNLGERRLRADLLQSYVNLPVGKNAIAVEVASGGAKRTYSVTVVRRDADLDEAQERSHFFREALLKGNADGLARAIAAGADAGSMIDFGNQRANGIVIAAGKGFAEAVEVLTLAGVDVNDVLRGPGTSADGASALFLAANGGHELIVGLLLEAGADPDLALPGPEVRKNSNLAGATPLLVAIYRGNEAVVHRLIEAGADVNRVLPDSIAGSDTSLSGASPLMLAAYAGKKELVRKLIDAGADVNYRVSGDRRSGGTNARTAGLTALKLATGRGHAAIADLLKEAGATR